MGAKALVCMVRDRRWVAPSSLAAYCRRLVAQFCPNACHLKRRRGAEILLFGLAAAAAAANDHRPPPLPA